MDASSIAFERSLTGFHYLFRDVFLLTVAKYMMTEEGEKEFRKVIVFYWFLHSEVLGLITGFHFLFRDVYLLTVAKHI